MVPARFAPALFALILSGVMSLIVSGVVTLKALGIPPNFLTLWLNGWLFAWAVAFPSAFFVAPLARRIVGRLTAAPRA
jgi:hypothetical protein